MQDLVSLFNQALTAVGHAAEVTDPEGNTKSASLCRLWYAPARRAVLSAVHWPSARKLESLAQISTRELGTAWSARQPWLGHTYAFELPVKCLRPQYLADYSQFTIGNLRGVKALMTNSPTAHLYYTEDRISPEGWESDLYDAVVYTLAARLNMAKSGKLQISNSLREEAYQLIRQAGARAANEQDSYHDAIPSHYYGAGYSLQMPVRFYYPTQGFNLGAV